jgi:transcriptional regulator with XRE-family HTH domain
MSAHLALKPREDFQYRHTFTAVGSGSNEQAPILYRDAYGRETQPTSANYGVIMVHEPSSWAVGTDWLASLTTRQVFVSTSIDLPSYTLAGIIGVYDPALGHLHLSVPVEHPNIGARVDRIREQLGVTMTQLAAALLLQRATLYRWYQGRQPHPGNETRVAAFESLSEAWSAQQLPPLRKFWDARIPALNLKVCDVLCDPLRDANALIASLPHIRSVTQSSPTLDPYIPKARRTGVTQPSAFDQTSPPLWDREE